MAQANLILYLGLQKPSIILVMQKPSAIRRDSRSTGQKCYLT